MIKMSKAQKYGAYQIHEWGIAHWMAGGRLIPDPCFLGGTSQCFGLFRGIVVLSRTN